EPIGGGPALWGGLDEARGLCFGVLFSIPFTAVKATANSASEAIGAKEEICTGKCSQRRAFLVAGWVRFHMIILLILYESYLGITLKSDLTALTTFNLRMILKSSSEISCCWSMWGPFLNLEPPRIHDSWRSEAPRVCCLGTVTLASTVVGIRSPKDLQTPRGSEAPGVFRLDAMEDSPTAPDPDRAFNAFLGRRRQKSGRGSTEEVTEISAHDGLKRSGSERVFAGSHPRLSDPAWSSEICELARAREQLENPASAVQDTWTTGVKPLQHFRRGPVNIEQENVESLIIWKGIEYEYKNILGLLRIINLSGNKFTGEIPIEVTQATAEADAVVLWVSKEKVYDYMGWLHAKLLSKTD
ncbi:hypothetical protein PanWU01x14_291320, partial [Parasponia andersonii]